MTCSHLSIIYLCKQMTFEVKLNSCAAESRLTGHVMKNGPSGVIPGETQMEMCSEKLY